MNKYRYKLNKDIEFKYQFLHSIVLGVTVVTIIEISVLLT